MLSLINNFRPTHLYQPFQHATPGGGHREHWIDTGYRQRSPPRLCVCVINNCAWTSVCLCCCCVEPSLRRQLLRLRSDRLTAVRMLPEEINKSHYRLSSDSETMSWTSQKSWATLLFNLLIGLGDHKQNNIDDESKTNQSSTVSLFSVDCCGSRGK